MNKFFHFIYQTSGGMLFLTILVSILSGAINTALITLLSRQLSPQAVNLSGFVALFLGLVGVATLLDLLTKRMLIGLSQKSSYQLRMSLAQQIAFHPLPELEKIGSARLLAVLTEDVSAIGHAFTQLPILCIALATTIGCIGYLAWLSPVMVLLLGGVMVPMGLGYHFIQRQARLSARKSRQSRDRLFQLYRDLTEGIKEILLHDGRRAAFLRQNLQLIACRLQQELVSSRFWGQMGNSWTQLIYLIFILAVIVWAGWWAIPLETMTSYALIVLYMKSSIGNMIGVMPALTEATVALNKIEATGLSLTNTSLTLPDPLPVTEPPSQIELTLKKVSYHYSGENGEEPFGLGPLDLTFHSGKVVFVVGGNGSGKTTLMKVITGLYVPTAGTILLNNQPIHDQNRQIYRQNFSAVFTDSYLFDGLLGIDKLNSDQQAQQYLTQLQLQNKVQLQNGQFSTTKLSQGQRKRLALLTAYLEDRPIYIFDEWAASQDPEFRRLFYHQFLPALRQRGKLVIAITHDDTYFDMADQILKLDLGQLI